MQILALLYISEPATQSLLTATTPLGNEPGIKAASASFGVEPDSAEEPFLDEGRKKELHSIVIQELLQTSKRKGPPHQLSQHGEYSGWVWTMPENRYYILQMPRIKPASDDVVVAVTPVITCLLPGRTVICSNTASRTHTTNSVLPMCFSIVLHCTVYRYPQLTRGAADMT